METNLPSNTRSGWLSACPMMLLAPTLVEKQHCTPSAEQFQVRNNACIPLDGELAHLAGCDIEAVYAAPLIGCSAASPRGTPMDDMPPIVNEGALFAMQNCAAAARRVVRAKLRNGGREIVRGYQRCRCIVRGHEAVSCEVFAPQCRRPSPAAV